MIADDEDEERLGIKFLLKKCGFCFDIIEASDGREALEKLKNNEVDILFTDVKMPFLNGLELSANARELFPQLQIIFFSGYDDFEYVKQALSLQAVDYILKPVNPVEFEKIIQLVVKRMEQRDIQQKYNQQSQKAYILTRLFNKISFDELNKKYSKKQLEFLQEYTRIILIEFENEFFGNRISDIEVLKDKIRGILNISFDLVDLNPSQGILLIKNGTCTEKEYKQMGQCIHLLIEKEYHTPCYLSVGSAIFNPRELVRVYAEAEQYLEGRFFHKGVYVYPMDTDKQLQEVNAEKEGQFLAEIEKDVKLRDVYSLCKNVDLLIETCRNNSFQSYIYTRFICANLLKILFQGLPGEEKELIVNIEQLYHCNCFQDIEIILSQVLKKVETKISQEQESPNHAIAIVEQYIHKHYRQGLSLDILADKVFLTPHYLSSIFSQEKGVGINKYIKNVRMEEAKELLLGTNMKISDICKMVGYSNLSYFCKAFRNEYGVTPEKYRDH